MRIATPATDEVISQRRGRTPVCGLGYRMVYETEIYESVLSPSRLELEIGITLIDSLNETHSRDAPSQHHVWPCSLSVYGLFFVDILFVLQKLLSTK